MHIAVTVRVMGYSLAEIGSDPIYSLTPFIHKAKVAHWQAGEDGRYSDRLRAYRFTDADGHFAFETEWPDLSPPHIHFIVTVEGYDVLDSQWIGDERQKAIDFTMVLEPK